MFSTLVLYFSTCNNLFNSDNQQERLVDNNNSNSSKFQFEAKRYLLLSGTKMHTLQIPTTRILRDHMPSRLRYHSFSSLSLTYIFSLIPTTIKNIPLHRLESKAWWEMMVLSLKIWSNPYESRGY